MPFMGRKIYIEFSHEKKIKNLLNQQELECFTIPEELIYGRYRVYPKVLT